MTIAFPLSNLWRFSRQSCVLSRFIGLHSERLDGNFVQHPRWYPGGMSSWSASQPRNPASQVSDLQGIKDRPGCAIQFFTALPTTITHSPQLPKTTPPIYTCCHETYTQFLSPHRYSCQFVVFVCISGSHRCGHWFANAVS